MLKNTYEGQVCSIARSLELIGERWTLLIVRDIFRGARRFDDLQKGLGIARNVLANRLDRLVEEGILERSEYREPGSRARSAPPTPSARRDAARSRSSPPGRTGSFPLRVPAARNVPAPR